MIIQLHLECVRRVCDGFLGSSGVLNISDDFCEKLLRFFFLFLRPLVVTKSSLFRFHRFLNGVLCGKAGRSHVVKATSHSPASRSQIASDGNAISLVLSPHFRGGVHVRDKEGAAKNMTHHHIEALVVIQRCQHWEATIFRIRQWHRRGLRFELAEWQKGDTAFFLLHQFLQQQLRRIICVDDVAKQLVAGYNLSGSKVMLIR
mmetsp:Transcript_57151/g.134523  ORF Transcript_57151/g.134523 Transcript_57151/m.134523 type:complete len:203 (-) Transcript_57151:171-779(-)